MVDTKTYRIGDIRPNVEFTVEVLDDMHEPIKYTEFAVSVDGGKEQVARSDDAGLVKVYSRAPATEIMISLN